MASAADDAAVAAAEDAPPEKRAKTTLTAAAAVVVAVRTCQFCANKKQVAASCVNVACKKCCLARAEVCAMHPKGTLYTRTVVVYSLHPIVSI